MIKLSADFQILDTNLQDIIDARDTIHGHNSQPLNPSSYWLSPKLNSPQPPQRPPPGAKFSSRDLVAPPRPQVTRTPRNSGTLPSSHTKLTPAWKGSKGPITSGTHDRPIGSGPGLPIIKGTGKGKGKSSSKTKSKTGPKGKDKTQPFKGGGKSKADQSK
jgi:hypothetical protein